MDVKTKSDGTAAMSGGSARETGNQHAGSEEIGKERESLGSFLWFLIKLVLAVLVFRIFIFSPFSIPSESMLPRLMNGDYLLAAKWPYGYSQYSLPFDAPIFAGRFLADQPERGDTVIFKHPVDDTDYIKRVIALPGDMVAIEGGQVILNGEAVRRERIADFDLVMSPNTGCTWGGAENVNAAGVPVCRYQQYRETLPGGRQYDVLDFGLTPGDTFPATLVPDGHMFVLGDNRDNSRDSRFQARSGDAVGIVPQSKLVGRAAIVMWSTDGSAEWGKPWTWFTATRWDRIGDTL